MADALYDFFEPTEARALTIQEWNSGNSLTVQYAKSGAHFVVVQKYLSFSDQAASSAYQLLPTSRKLR
jgi:hypothetical protein